ncbi:MAG: cell division protein FtsZ, partial [Candidatus Aenigmarchaeota archaeon]|nr:cell division protein FtsZ [Candidatus Aenigmarchaeota archaeon]
VTKPFTFEGKQRQIIAEAGFKELINRVDSIITIANDRLLEIIDKNTTLIHSFRMIDKILEESVRGVTDVINTPGLINIDFADIKAVMEQAGTASITIGQSTGENSLLQATKLAVTNPLLDNSVEGAKNAILIITGDKNLSMHEVNEATQMLVEMLDPQAKIIFGIVTDEQMKNKTKVTLIITGFEKDINQMHQTRPAFQTKKMEFYEQPTIKKIVEENNIEDQLDIPAFIRNKKLEK